MIQVKRKTEKKPTLENKFEDLNSTNSQLLMANAQQQITIQAQSQMLANLLLEVANLKNATHLDLAE